MALADGPHAKIDWSSAEVRAGTLTLSLRGAPTSVWAEHLADLLSKSDHRGRMWGSVEVTRKYVKVDSVQMGVAHDLHRVLEGAVTETNVALASNGVVSGRRSHDRVSSASIAGSVFLVALSVLAVALQRANWSVPVRPIIVVTFITVGPGWAILRLWQLASGWAGVALVLAISLSLAMIVSGLLLYLGAWSPFASIVALASITVALSAISFARALPVLSTGRGRSK